MEEKDLPLFAGDFEPKENTAQPGAGSVFFPKKEEVKQIGETAGGGAAAEEAETDIAKTQAGVSGQVEPGIAEDRERRPQKKRFSWWAAGLVFLLAADLIGMLLWGIWRPGERVAKQEIAVYIPPNNNTRQIALLLKENGVINSAWSFRVLAKMLGWDRYLKSGLYTFRPGSNIYQALHKVWQGQQLLVNALIPEGFTIRQTARRLNELLGIDADAFLAELARIDWEILKEKYPFLKTLLQNTLEGFLFPDTYRIAYADAQPEIMADLMLKRFDEVVMPLYSGSDSKYSLRQVVTLASLVEKEAQLPEERPLVAAVFLGRLARGMNLQSCATINYILPEPKKVLSYADLKIQSSYNTYVHKGLPPTPICSPGLAAIKAVLNPARVKYLYFVSRGDGGHVFSGTYAQHLEAQRRIQQEQTAAAEEE